MGKSGGIKTGYLVFGLILIGGCDGALAPQGSAAAVEARSSAVVAGAGFTTFDATQGGCKDSPNGINCNNYVAAGDVYASGGPSAAGLADGSYFFAVLAPGYQASGFTDGSNGNLSDTTAGGTAGDVGGGDDVSNRTFTVAGHAIVGYAGTHALGTSPNGRSIIQLAPFDPTDNAGGVYIVAICQTGASRPSQCKYDAFRIEAEEATHHSHPVVSGMKYYDANANGQRDPGEVGISGWPINYTDQVGGTVLTDASGGFSLTLIADSYAFWESVALGPWMQTGNLVNQTSTTGIATASLNPDKTYSVTVADDSTASGLYFGNLCLGGGKGLTLGFWSNKNGAALFGADDLALMVSLHLRNANGTDFDPASYTKFRTWLLSATATNMAYMLSAQLAAMELNVLNAFVNGGALIYAPGTASANVNGFATVGAIMAEADASLAANGYTVAAGPIRTAQEAVKNALDRANNNLNFVQAGPGSCPAPVYP